MGLIGIAPILYGLATQNSFLMSVIANYFREPIPDIDVAPVAVKRFREGSLAPTGCPEELGSIRTQLRSSAAKMVTSIGCSNGLMDRGWAGSFAFSDLLGLSPVVRPRGDSRGFTINTTATLRGNL